MDKLDFLDTPEGVGEDVQPEAQAPEVVEAQPEPEPEADGPARGPDGKFLPKESRDEKPEVPPGYLPMAALLDEREKRQQAEERLRSYEQQYEDTDAQQVPDIQQALFAQALTFSRRLAELQHGADTVNKVQAWAKARCDADPFFNQKVYASQDPYGVALDEWRKEQAVQQIGDPAQIQAFLQWQATQQAAPAVSPQQPTPPRSIASDPNAGGTKPGHHTPSPEEVFGSVFKG